MRDTAPLRSRVPRCPGVRLSPLPVWVRTACDVGAARVRCYNERLFATLELSHGYQPPVPFRQRFVG